MKKRIAEINRNTKETQIEMKLNLDGSGNYEIKTPIGFLNHMLELFAKHGLFDLDIKAAGDIQVDEHHLVEDVGIVLGQAFLQALGDKKGINRYGFFILPMDEVLATSATDFCGRFAFRFDCELNRKKVGDLSTELVCDFWDAFAQNAKMNLHIKIENGRNTHHKIEAIFKSVARALRMSCAIDERVKTIPSTKGVL
ncbi:imidazoleglycerol-phosphate dehydratase HisB [Candidatus Gottesmanbacteria bacterium]|nr:imidazoleglycerol-phosphate dehydratase HisB [Candidatus Gottesmanbacteria bacterium]